MVYKGEEEAILESFYKLLGTCTSPGGRGKKACCGGKGREGKSEGGGGREEEEAGRQKEGRHFFPRLVDLCAVYMVD